MIARLFILAAACLMLGSGPRQPDCQLQENFQIEGTWKVESALLNGKQILPERSRWQVAFKGNRVQVLESGQTLELIQFGFRLDQTAFPYRLDLQDKGEVLLGICQIQGDKLVICLAELANLPRPRDFAARRGVVLIVMKRGK